MIPLFALALVLGSCSGAAPPPPTPDPGVFNAAVETAIAATRTVEAATAQAAAPNSSPSPASSPINPTPVETPAAAPVCTVVAATLNLRSGPGVAYEPPLMSIPAGTALTPLAFSPVGFPGGQWVQVQVGSQIGWVNADPQFITCNLDPAGLPPTTIPPTPTSAPTPTPIPDQPTPTPSPTPESFAFFEPPGGGNDNIGGGVIFPGYTQGQLDYDDLVFRDRLVFNVVAFDKSEGQTDGAGIDNVRFEISDFEGTTIFYEHTEENVPYCLFGDNGGPPCNVWRFAEHQYRWPEPFENQAIVNGYHFVRIRIKPEQGPSANWEFDFTIEGAEDQGEFESSNLIAQIVQTGPGTTSDFVDEALVFQVFASANGSDDGAGIDRVDLRIIKDGQEVYQRTEQNAAYCAFSGGEPDCNIWVFADHGHTWPGGQPVEPGPHTLHATVYAEDGQTTTVEIIVEIQL